MVFGPFDIDDLYNVIIENMEGLEVLWGLFKPMASDLELIEEGVVSALDSKNANPLNAPRVTSPRKVKLNWSVSLPSQKKTIALTSVAAE